MKIGNLEVGKQPIIAAEVGLNHNGSIDRAIEMIGIAKTAGCDIVKFQTFKASEFCDPKATYTYLSQGLKVTELMSEMFKRCELPDKAWPILKAECDRQGILFLSTPQNPSDLDKIIDLLPAIKIGSDDAVNYQLLDYYASKGLPLILSTGMTFGEEIYIPELTECVLLVCTSLYPCPHRYANLKRIITLRDYNAHDPFIKVGFSDHTMGNTAAITAVGAGAVFFEGHMTLDPNLPGPDHHWSRNPGELLSWVSSIREAWELMGSGLMELSARELANKVKYQRKSGQKLRGAN